MQAVKTCTIIKKKWEVRKQPNFTIGVLLYLLLSGRARVSERMSSEHSVKSWEFIAFIYE